MTNLNTPGHELNGEALDRVLNTYLADPTALDAATRKAIDHFSQRTSESDGRGSHVAAAGSSPRTMTGASNPMTVARVVALAEAIRYYGHFAVQLDPLGFDKPHDTHLDSESYGLSEAEMRGLPASIIRGPVAEGTRDAFTALEALRRVYCSRIGFEFSHLVSADERQWLANAAEANKFAPELERGEALAILDRLSRIEAFERILHRAFVGQKRFSIEGLDMLIPMIDEIVASASRDNYANIVIGMAHRGRLGVRTFITGQSFQSIFRAFALAAQGGKDAGPDPGDVKYHLGATGRSSRNPTGPLIHLRSNPSHLEWVNPVVEGFTRALQDDRSQPGAPAIVENRAIALLVHGDAAFPGQGIVAETLNMGGLAGYSTGGTIHIIGNNQIGFTTNPEDSRSTRYSSDLAKGFDLPIIHVNADDVEACIAVVRLAYAYRARFHRDFIIDVVGYRRWGHNEGDEPAYTQPQMYAAISRHSTVRDIWAGKLEERGWLRPGEGDQKLATIDNDMRASAEAAGVSVEPAETRDRARVDHVLTGVPFETLKALNGELLKRPEGFKPMAKLEQQLQRTRGSLEIGKSIDWGHAESLAFASILSEGTPIRLAGEDTARGTFAHRQMVLHDTETGATYNPLQHLPQAKASFEVVNSPLSEAAGLGFEYGYSLGAAGTLVLWEAQFGDFANTAQPIIDQFLAAGRSKWAEMSGLVLLLPHGYEGQGPEHSSARMERFLQLFAEDNIRIICCSTADQYFHLLRRQVFRLRSGDARPLVIFTPKSLLRNQAAAAPVEKLTTGGFEPVLDDPIASQHPEDVTRVVMCSGKLSIELLTSPLRNEHPNIAIVRLERIAPFPTGAIARILAQYANWEELVWAQEEPRNMGAWGFVSPRLFTMVPHGNRMRYVGRLERASPAEGSAQRHAIEQARIMRAVFGE